MKRVVVLIVCLVACSMASVYDAAPYVKKRHRARDVVYPYMEVSAGGMYSVSDYKTKSKTNYYHDLKRDEMVYDKDLYYNIYSFEGYSPWLDTKAGIIIIRRIALYLSFGCFWSVGEYRYKLYSRDKEEFSEDDARLRQYWGFGIKYYPVIDEQSPFYDAFVGSSIRGVFLNDNEKAWEKYGMYYEDGETIFELEIGKLWKISEYYSVGLSIKAVGGFGGSTENIGGFHVDKHPVQNNDDVTLNSKHIGAAITIVRK